jgi:hypothetical protein
MGRINHYLSEKYSQYTFSKLNFLVSFYSFFHLKICAQKIFKKYFEIVENKLKLNNN